MTHRIILALALVLTISTTPRSARAGDPQALASTIGVLQTADNTVGAAYHFAGLYHQAASQGWAEGAAFFKTAASNFHAAAAAQWKQGSDMLGQYQSTYGELSDHPELIQYQQALEARIGGLLPALQ